MNNLSKATVEKAMPNSKTATVAQPSMLFETLNSSFCCSAEKRKQANHAKNKVENGDVKLRMTKWDRHRDSNVVSTVQGGLKGSELNN